MSKLDEILQKNSFELFKEAISKNRDELFFELAIKVANLEKAFCQNKEIDSIQKIEQMEIKNEVKEDEKEDIANQKIPKEDLQWKENLLISSHDVYLIVNPSILQDKQVKPYKQLAYITICSSAADSGLNFTQEAQQNQERTKSSLS